MSKSKKKRLQMNPPETNDKDKGTQKELVTIPGNSIVLTPCHTGTVHVFDDPKTGCKWYAGGSSRKFLAPSGSILVALADSALDTNILSNIGGIPLQEPTVYIKWWDGSAAPIKTKTDWEGMLRALRGAKMDVAAACMGGHGRTGTFLSIMAWLMELPQKEGLKPIEYIRKIYCEECVETLVQFKQVKEITGVDETDLFIPPKTYSYVGGYQGTYEGGVWSGGNWSYSNDLKGGKTTKETTKRAFDMDTDPEKENLRFGWFWGKIEGASSTSKYDGYPASKGIWTTDSMGWYWLWDKSEKALFTPLEKNGTQDTKDTMEKDIYEDNGEDTPYLNGYNI